MFISKFYTDKIPQFFPENAAEFGPTASTWCWRETKHGSSLAEKRLSWKIPMHSFLKLAHLLFASLVLLNWSTQWDLPKQTSDCPGQN